MNCLKSIIPLLWPLAVIFLFSGGCNFTTQSYNTGKLLNPGETLTSIGVGKREYYSIESPQLFYSSNSSLDTIKSYDFSLCWDYRLGVLRTLPFGRGVEIGFHLEGPTQFNPDSNNISLGAFKGAAILEFDSRFGFKDICLGRGIFHHSIGLGWGVGAWIDNGWFTEYAAGWEYKWITPYANFRAELLPTDPTQADSLTESYTPFKYEKRSWTTRTAAGISMHVPHWWISPEFIVPEITVIYPHYSAISHYGITYHVGFRWLNGI